MKQTRSVVQILVLSLLFLFGGLDSLCVLAGGKHPDSNGSAERTSTIASSLPYAQAAPAGTASISGKVMRP